MWDASDRAHGNNIHRAWYLPQQHRLTTHLQLSRMRARVRRVVRNERRCSHLHDAMLGNLITIGALSNVDIHRGSSRPRQSALTNERLCPMIDLCHWVRWKINNWHTGNVVTKGETRKGAMARMRQRWWNASSDVPSQPCALELVSYVRRVPRLTI